MVLIHCFGFLFESYHLYFLLISSDYCQQPFAVNIGGRREPRRGKKCMKMEGNSRLDVYLILTENEIAIKKTQQHKKPSGKLIFPETKYEYKP